MIIGNVSKYYLISDLHLNHKRIITDFGFRPENYEKLIINNWKNTVHPQDIVFDLGDVTWGSQENLLNIISDLPGTKILIRGNHDRTHSDNWFIKAGYSLVLKKAQIDNIILSHFPSDLSDKEVERGIINIHGHFHNVESSKWEEKLVKRITKNHYLFSLEDIGYKPVLLDSAVKNNLVLN